jgi:tripartite-type tricarboxylate transporter receptor subunit TctC
MKEEKPMPTTKSILNKKLCVILLSAIFFSFSPALFAAETYPNKPIRLILPFPPGGGTDSLGRIIGQRLAERLGQPVLPENRPGAAGTLGVEFAAKAPPNGYTIVLAIQTFAIAPSIYRKLNFDPIKDLAPITLVAQIPNILLVRPSLPVKSLKELVQYAKANPNKLNFGSGGIAGSGHLGGELLKSLANIDIVHVPYKGAGPALIGLMGGEVDILVASASGTIPPLQAGKVRALAVLGNERTPSLPNVPTAKEAGMDNYEVISWYGVLAPAGTPRDIINRLNEELHKVVKEPDTIEKMKKIGADPMINTPEQFGEFIKADIVRWSKVIKEANISIIE